MDVHSTDTVSLNVFPVRGCAAKRHNDWLVYIGSNLKFYFRRWKASDSKDNFFRWYVLVSPFFPSSPSSSLASLSIRSRRNGLSWSTDLVVVLKKSGWTGVTAKILIWKNFRERGWSENE